MPFRSAVRRGMVAGRKFRNRGKRSTAADAQTDRLIKGGKLFARGPYGKTAGVESYLRIAEAELESQTKSANRKKR